MAMIDVEITEDAYDQLESRRRDDETLSEAIIRLADEYEQSGLWNR